MPLENGIFMIGREWDFLPKSNPAISGTFDNA
jgi:hypothetical protein